MITATWAALQFSAVALAARDATTHDNWNIPDGFYLVANTQNPQKQFQEAIIDAVKQITHIAPADESGKIIGADLLSEGLAYYWHYL